MEDEVKAELVESDNEDQDQEVRPPVEPTLPVASPETDEQHNRIRWSRILKSGSAILIFWNMGISLIFLAYPYVPEYNDYFFAYAVYAVMLLFSPLAVYLADTRWGRQKTVLNSLYFLFWSVLLIAIFNCLVTIGFIPTFSHPYQAWNSRNTIASVLLAVGFLPPCLLGMGLIIVSLIAYNANVIQFAWEKLKTLPKENAMLFIHWFVWSSFVGQLIMKPLHVNQTSDKWSLTMEGLTLIMTVPAFLLAFAITLFLGCHYKSKLFPGDDQLTNPYTVIIKILNFVRKNKYTVQENQHDDIPQSRIDIACEKFGGPFQTGKVEEVKTFLSIACILLTLGPALAIELAASEQLPHFGYHLDPESRSTTLIMSALTPLVVVAIVPMYTCIVRPFIKYHTPRTLKRIGIGMILFLVSIVYCGLIDVLGHITTGSTACFLGHDFPLPPYVHSSDCSEIDTIFDTNHSNVTDTCVEPLNITLAVLLVPYILNGIAYILFYVGVYEFIMTQTPFGMKGLAMGMFFGIKGASQLMGLLILYAPFTAWTSQTTHSFPSCGFVYWLINAVIALIGIIVFIWRARLYRPRKMYITQPTPPINEQLVVEEHA